MIELIAFDTGSTATSDRVCVDTALGDGYLTLVYRWCDWAVAPIVRGRAENPQRRDELWRTTCAEIFVALDDEPYVGGPYLEFNFSPTGDWAAYRFDATRTGMRPHVWQGDEAPRVLLTDSSEGYMLDVLLPLAAVGGGVHRVAYASVIETSEGLSYWALKHPTDRPDFHHPQSFAALLELPA